MGTGACEDKDLNKLKNRTNSTMRSHEKPIAAFFFLSIVKLELEIRSGPEDIEGAKVVV
jgi:hypothetical protein